MNIESLEGVERTLLIPLLIKAKEYVHKNPIIKDENAYNIITKLKIDEKKFTIIKYSAVSSLFRARKFDLYVKEYMNINPDGLVIEIGSGLDFRFKRLDNGRIKWINIDLPNVIKLRNELFVKHERVKNMDTPLEQMDWKSLKSIYDKPIIISEGVFPYFEKEYAEELIKTLNKNFPGCILCFDAVDDFVIKKQRFKALEVNNARMKWGVNNKKQIQSIIPDCMILEEWRYYDKIKSRNGMALLFKYIPFLNNLFRIYKIKFVSERHL